MQDFPLTYSIQISDDGISSRVFLKAGLFVTLFHLNRSNFLANRHSVVERLLLFVLLVDYE